MTTQGPGFSSGQPKSKVDINCGQTQWKTFSFAPLDSHLSDYDPLCPKMFPLLIGWKGTRAQKSTAQREDGRECACNQRRQFPWCHCGTSGKQKPHCEPVSPSISLHLLLEPCECLTGRRVPRSPNNTSCHPENLLFHSALLVACVWSREQEASGWTVDAHSNTGAVTYTEGWPNLMRICISTR